MPYGVDDRGLKGSAARSRPGWLLEEGLPFYRFQRRRCLPAEVDEMRPGTFTWRLRRLGAAVGPLCHPVAVFGQNTALSAPDRFLAEPLANLRHTRQEDGRRTPCAFRREPLLAPGEATTLYAVVGAGSVEQIRREEPRLAQPAYLRQKRREANRATGSPAVVATSTCVAPS